MSFIIIFGALSFPVNISSSGLGLLINDYSSGGRCMDRGRRRVRRQAGTEREIAYWEDAVCLCVGGRQDAADKHVPPHT